MSRVDDLKQFRISQRVARGMTPEQAAHAEDALDARLANMTAARDAIVKATGGKRRVQGRIDCPVCKGLKTLGFVVHGNGHIHAACSTDDCVCWME